MATRITHTSRIPQLRAALPGNVERVVERTTFAIEGRAKQAAPVDTGTLRNSIQGSIIGAHEGEVAVGAEYGIYVEYGTVHQAAQPYLTPAVEAERGPFLAAVGDALKGE